MGQGPPSKSQAHHSAGSRPATAITVPDALPTRPPAAKCSNVGPSLSPQPRCISTAILPSTSTVVCTAVPAPPIRSTCTAVSGPPVRSIGTAVLTPPIRSTCTAVSGPPVRSIGTAVAAPSTKSTCTAVAAPPTKSICTAVPALPTKSICAAIPTPPSTSNTTTTTTSASAGSNTAASIPSLIPSIPPERERNFKMKKGFEYLLVTIEFQKGKKFGLGMVHTENRVLVNQVDENSMCGNIMKYLDRICDVEGVPVTDKELCKKQIVKGLKKEHKVSLAVERPVTKDRVAQVQNLLNMMKDQPPSVVLEVDVKEILARYNQRLKGGSVKKQKSALVKRDRSAAKVSMDPAQPQVIAIGMDREHLQEDLEKVPRKTYERSLARLQSQKLKEPTVDTPKSITTMLQLDESKAAEVSAANAACTQPDQKMNLTNVIAPAPESPKTG